MSNYVVGDIQGCYREFTEGLKLIEFDETDKIFTSPSEQKTNDYITGRYG